jgi:hypothetical protein
MYRIIGADGKEYGPVSADQLRRWITEGRADANTRIAVEGSLEWRTLGSIPEFASLLAPAPLRALMPPVQATNSFAVAALVMGILAIILSCCCYGIPFNLMGVVFALIALHQIRNEPERYAGKNLAITGLILSALSILVSVVLLLIGVTSGLHDMSRHTYKL